MSDRKKEISMLFDKLVKAGQEYNSSLRKIGNYLDELAHAIDECLPRGLGDIKFSSKGLTFRRRGPCSNVGCLGPAFWDKEEYALISTKRQPGISFYLHNDFSCHVQVASRAARRRAAANILDWFEDFVEYIEKLASETDVSELEHLVEKVKSIAEKVEG